MKRKRLLVVAIAGAALVPRAFAHEARPSFLKIRQTDAETYSFLWKKPTGGEVEIQIAPVVPEGCRLATAASFLMTGSSSRGTRGSASLLQRPGYQL